MTRLNLRRAAISALPLVLLPVSACGGSGGYPPLADLKAVTAPKPLPGDEIATDPVAEAKYNADVESWGEGLRAAGIRLCRFFDETGMPGVECPK